MPSQDELNAELLQKSAAALQQMQDQLDSVEESQHEPIAIIGMACRLPGQSDTPEEFWQMLDAARDGVREVPPERWDLDAFYSPDTEAEGKMYTREGGFVDDIDQFDPGIFGITPREAISMDPQQRMLLETSWEALERAGIAPDSLTGTQTGVFVGVSSQDYYQNTMVNRTDINPYSGTGAGLNVATGRISYVLGLQGPNFAVDTACSSSLVALHTAITSLRQGESSLALAGGVNAIINPMNSVYFCKLGALSPDCRCKTFDASANGYVRGEGAGMLVLKRLSDAQEDGDKILAVLRGSAINHDGRSGGLTVPNGLAQKAVLNAALDNARLDPSEVSYIEAHGTGTPLGDPIEMHALIDVFTQERDESDPLVVGSVKTNIGHLESAAGVAGVIKVVLAMQNEKLPKHLHLNELNPHISLDGAPVKFLHDAMDWGRNDEKSRIAGISSFGISGTNAHVIVEEADPYQIEREEPEEADSLPQVLALSARSPQAVAEMAGRLQASLAATPDVPLSHICRTIATGRSVQPIRAAVSADSVSQLSERLKTLARGQTDIGIVSADKPVSGKPKIAFLFSGQGAQYNGMGRELYEQEPVFCEALEQADEALEPYLGCSIIDIMHAEDDERLHDTEFTQPALFALEYALATLWRDWGVEPELVMGHSVGEFAAACISEVLTLDEAAGLIATRGRLMQSLPAGGGMAAIVAKADDVKTWIEPYAGRLEIAAANAPRNTVVSGELAALEELVDALTDKDVRVSQLRVSHAFHSHLLEPMLGELKDAADKLTHRQPVMRYISNLTGTAITQESLNGDYWANHARQPVLFEKGIQAAADAGIDCFIEIGPHATLISMAQQCVAQPDVHWLASLKRNADDLTAMNETLGALHVKGVNVAWENVYAYVDAEPVILPTYPFERETYWIERRSALTSDNNVFATSAGGDHALLGQRLQTAGRDILFQCALNTRTHPWLVDHAVSGQPIFPATGYLEIALAAARVLKPEHDYVLEQIAFEMPLALQQESSAIVQTVLRPDGSSGDLEFEIFSLKDEQSGEWQRHALGRMVKSTANSLQINVEELQVNLSKRHDAQQNYAQMSAAGMEYGPAFQGVTQLQSGDGESFAHITCPESLSNVGMSLHPALLDACLQALGVTFEVEDGDSLFLPVALDQLAVYRQELPDAFVCHTKLTETTSDTLTGEVLLMSESGDLFARLESLRLRKTSLSKVKRMLGSVQKSVSHELSWVEKPLELSGESVTDKILVLSDKHGVGDKCIAAFNKLAGDSSADIVSLSLDEQASVEDIQDAITSAIGDDKKAHVLATFGCDLMALAEQTGSNRQTIEAASQMTSQLLLNLAQALARIDTKTLAFTLVTSGAQAVAQGPCITQPEASLLWGMGRVMQSEMPMVNTVLCDLDPGDMANSINGLMQQLQTPHTEAHVCWRHGVRFAQRLGAAAEPLGKTELVQLQIPQRGELSDLVLAQVESQQPGPDQVKIAVRATGLNFRDVLNALGMYPGDPGPLGGECAGTIIALGEKVTGFNIGDRVTGIAPGSFRTEVLADSRQVAVIPLEMDFASAATLPITFLTAHYALNRLGKMKKRRTGADPCRCGRCRTGSRAAGEKCRAGDLRHRWQRRKTRSAKTSGRAAYYGFAFHRVC